MSVTDPTDVRHVRLLMSRARVGYRSDVRHVRRLMSRARVGFRIRRAPRATAHEPRTCDRRLPRIDAHVGHVKKG